MNDDLSSPQAAARANDNDTSDATNPPHDAANNETPQERLRKRILAQSRKKADFIHDILANLNTLICAELCYLYYLDCSFFRLILRTFIQVVFLSPNPKPIAPPSKTGSKVPAILSSNILCIFLHLITAQPHASELTRGYLHGGIIIDFIGQKGPTSKFVLVLLDLVVIVLQCVMLTVHIEEARLKIAIASKNGPGSGDLAAAASAQDADAEERGVLQSGAINGDDIELQSFSSRLRNEPASNSNGNGNDDDDDNDDEARPSEADALLAERVRRTEVADEGGALDLFYSGNAIVSEFHVLHTVREQWAERDSAAQAQATLQTVGHSAGYGLETVRHGLSLRLDRLRRG